jgi:hypothetical protein
MAEGFLGEKEGSNYLSFYLNFPIFFTRAVSRSKVEM